MRSGVPAKRAVCVPEASWAPGTEHVRGSWADPGRLEIGLGAGHGALRGAWFGKVCALLGTGLSRSLTAQGGEGFGCWGGSARRGEQRGCSSGVV